MFLTGLFERRASVNVAHPKDPVLASWFATANTAAGVSVSHEQAMRLTAVYRAVKIIAESIGQLPCKIYGRKSDGTRYVDYNHDLYELLHDRPNRWQTPIEFKEMLTGHAVLRGNGYAEKIPSPTKPIAELIPLHPDRVRAFWAPDGLPAYEYRDLKGQPRIILQSEMLHIRAFSSDGLLGLDPISYMRESLGLALAAEEFGSRFFGNGSNPTGVLEIDGKLSDPAYKRLVESWQERHQGLANAHRPAILEEGLKWQSIGIHPNQAQFLETRKFQVTEIARMFGVPPHMLADLERATFTNIEHQGLEFIKYCLGPWLVRWEETVKRDLIYGRYKKTHYAKFNADAFARGDTKSRFESYRIGREIGVLSANDIREREDMDRIEGGDTYLQPLNMTKQGAKENGD